MVTRQTVTHRKQPALTVFIMSRNEIKTAQTERSWVIQVKQKSRKEKKMYFRLTAFISDNQIGHMIVSDRFANKHKKCRDVLTPEQAHSPLMYDSQHLWKLCPELSSAFSLLAAFTYSHQDLI